MPDGRDRWPRKAGACGGGLREAEQRGGAARQQRVFQGASPPDLAPFLNVTLQSTKVRYSEQCLYAESKTRIRIRKQLDRGSLPSNTRCTAVTCMYPTAATRCARRQPRLRQPRLRQPRQPRLPSSVLHAAVLDLPRLVPSRVLRVLLVEVLRSHVEDLGGASGCGRFFVCAHMRVCKVLGGLI